uniref:outer membrane beta-barrel protein n=1 Tax=Prevotella sp. TaxID=59823 RepID=UPI0040253971
MSNNDWTNKLRDQLADYQEPVSRDLWAGIEQSLAQKTGHQEVSKPGKIIHINTWKRWSAAAAAVALLGVGGSYVYFHQEEDKLASSQLAMATDKPSASAVAEHSHPMGKTSENGAGNSLDSRDDNVGLGMKRSPKQTVDGKNAGRQLLTDQTVLLSSASENEVMPTSENELMVVSVDSQPVSSAEEKTESTLQQDSPTRQNQKEKSIDNLFGNTVVSDAYQFSHHKETAGLSMKLYAENLSPNLGLSTSDDSYASSGSDVLADPMPGVVPDPTVGGVNDIDYLMASYKEVQKTYKGEAKHHAPVSVGLQVAFGIAPRLSLSSGFVYTRTSSDFYPYAPHNNYNVHQVLHYVGIPVGLNYELWKSGGFHAYVMAGAEADLNVKNDTEEEGVKKENAKRDRVQFSGKASLGAQYDITPNVGLYIEPGAKYYIDNGSEIENTFKDKKLNFNFQFGLRFNL